MFIHDISQYRGVGSIMCLFPFPQMLDTSFLVFLAFIFFLTPYLKIYLWFAHPCPSNTEHCLSVTTTLSFYFSHLHPRFTPYHLQLNKSPSTSTLAQIYQCCSHPFLRYTPYPCPLLSHLLQDITWVRPLLLHQHLPGYCILSRSLNLFSFHISHVISPHTISLHH